MESSDIPPLVKPNKWLLTLIKSIALVRSGDSSSAIALIDEDPVLSHIPQGFASKGKAYFCLGNHRLALSNLEKVSSLWSTGSI